jgi:hypothetical protein
MEFKLYLAAFHFRADWGGKLKLELHAVFSRSLHVALRRPETMKTRFESRL